MLCWLCECFSSTITVGGRSRTPLASVENVSIPLSSPCSFGSGEFGSLESTTLSSPPVRTSGFGPASAGFSFSGPGAYEAITNSKIEKFKKDTGLELEVGMGIDTTAYSGFKNVKVSVEVANVDFNPE